MELTRAERLILSNQYKLLILLDEDEDNVATYEKNIEVIESGFELEYDWIAGHIQEDVVSSDECRDVLEILDMFRTLDASYTALGAANRSGITPKDVRFAGFDGNHEDRLLAYVKHLNSQGKYPESKAINSHMPKHSYYRRMVAKWHSFGTPRTLSHSQLVDVINA
jgi:uncharacterized protein YfbU (UPF0304 family)